MDTHHHLLLRTIGCSRRQRLDHLLLCYCCLLLLSYAKEHIHENQFKIERLHVHPQEGAAVGWGSTVVNRHNVRLRDRVIFGAIFRGGGGL